MSKYTEDKVPFSPGDRISLNRDGILQLGEIFGLNENDAFIVKEIQWQEAYSPEYGHLIVIEKHIGKRRDFDGLWEKFAAIVEAKNWGMEEPDFSLNEIHEAQATYEKING